MFMNFFSYTKENIEFKIKTLDEKSIYLLNEITFLSPFSSQYSENNIVRCFWYKPRAPSNKAVVVLHGWRSTNSLNKYVCTTLVRRDYNSILFILPYHGPRTPKGAKSGQHFFTTDEDQSFNAYRQAISELMLLGDYLSDRGFTLGVVGTSLGAIVGNTLMGLDKRYRVGVSILGAGNINRIVWEGLAGRFIRRFLRSRGLSKRDYYKILEHYNNFLEKYYQNGRPPETRFKWYYIDPLTYAHINYPRNLLMINAIFDSVIPRQAVLEFRKRAGNPPIIWLPCGHFTTFMFQSFIMQQMLMFLKSRWSK